MNIDGANDTTCSDLARLVDVPVCINQNVTKVRTMDIHWRALRVSGYEPCVCGWGPLLNGTTCAELARSSGPCMHQL